MMHHKHPRCWVTRIVSLAFILSMSAIAASIISEDLVDFESGTLKETKSQHMCIPESDQITGYFKIDKESDKNYFYWYFPHKSGLSTTPVVLWLTGGPGCSGELALFFENGPCTFNTTGIVPNPFSWTEAASLIYVDQPAGTGFSYSSPEGMDSDEAGVSRDLDIFVRTFMKHHPEVSQNPFYIFAESYGGHYAPATAWHIHQSNQKGVTPHVNLQGVGIGNGLTNPEIQYQYYPTMIYNYTKVKLGEPLVGLDVYTKMVEGMPQCIQMIQACNNGNDDACEYAASYCDDLLINPFEATGRNIYDIRIPCDGDLCYNIDPVIEFLNDPEVQKAIGVDREWAACSNVVYANFRTDFLKRFDGDVAGLLGAGIRVLIYAGDCDYICNWIGNKAWALKLDWKGSSEFQAAADLPLRFPGAESPVGTIRSVDGFTFVKVLDAGHMVPHDQPYAALMLLKSFIGENSQPNDGTDQSDAIQA